MSDYIELMAENERLYEDAILPDSGPGIVAELPSDQHSTPPRPADASPSPPAPPRPDAVRAVRRLVLGGMENMQATESMQLRRIGRSPILSRIARNLLLPAQVARVRGAERIFTIPDAS